MEIDACCPENAGTFKQPGPYTLPSISVTKGCGW